MIGVGFSGPKVVLSRIPGWEPESYAYHGDDGQCFSNTTSGKPYGPKFGTLDVIGCGINFRTGTAFFTKNGHYIGMPAPGWILDFANIDRHCFQGLEGKPAVLSYHRHEETWRDSESKLWPRTIRFRHRQNGTGKLNFHLFPVSMDD